MESKYLQINADGVQLLHSIENQAVDTSKVAPETIAKVLLSFNFYRIFKCVLAS